MSTTQFKDLISYLKSAPKVSNDNIGKKMMLKMGWQDGRGLGKNGQGRTEIIIAEHKVRKWRSGLGLDLTKHRSQGYSYRIGSYKIEFVPPSSGAVTNKDEAFLQRLKESRDFWDLREIPSYEKLSCATCELNRQPENYVKMLKELTHDVVNLLAYHHDCEDKSNEYECKYCVDEFNGVEDEDAERYACPDECYCEDCEREEYSSDEDEDYYDDDDLDDDEEDLGERKERIKEEKAFKKRNQRDFIKHLTKEHKKKLTIFLRFKQNFIPLCEMGFIGDGNCEWGLDDVFRCLDLNKGHKFLHMEEPPLPASPRSPKAWQYMMGMENDDNEMYEYENNWNSDLKIPPRTEIQPLQILSKLSSFHRGGNWESDANSCVPRSVK